MNDESRAPQGEELLAVGKIVRPHGIRGALVVEPMTDWPERFSSGEKLVLEKSDGEQVEVTVGSGGMHKGRLLVTLEGINDRDEAEELRGLYLLIHPCDAHPLDEGEYWAHELVGMSVSKADGPELGRVSEVHCRAAQDLLTVRREDGTEFGVPFVKEFVKEVDMKSKTITVDLPEGMEP